MPARRSATVLDPSAVVRHPVPGEPVDVRTETVEGVPTPDLLLRGGRLWVVRSAERLAGPTERWRVRATPRPSLPPVPLELTVRDGRWSLVELAPGAQEPTWR